MTQTMETPANAKEWQAYGLFIPYPFPAIYSPLKMVPEAPLAANINHLGTAFGGSLHALPTLACYAVLWTLLREAGLDGHVIVKRSSADYRQPVKGLLRAVCVRPAPAIVAEFVADLHRHKKARMELTAIVEGADGKPAVDFSGSFVAVV